ncbi:energy-coupling factor ABC transporter ATP-binding protein [Oceanispirochaeta sp.]|uniref:energy-coupling factor ABC transporter ATP-binding protein n=1 Tax=Oceanispirochaeta sp. TaxID=2035350 RepID=UPI002606AB9E|nr:ABC transporter ATP-binding protein [Oceanispirochaeta sp.]MDA3956110.1 ABC transporter ATP-binding protein [Oceanispirochaeta sp.]
MLEVKGLNRSYGSAGKVLNNINLRFQDGSFTIIAGPNGSGKTQLMRHLNGLLKPQSGQILLDETDIQKNLMEVRRQIGLVFQNADSQIVGQTVASDIAFGPENLRWSREKINLKVEKILQELSITELKNRRPHTLSGGEKRRCVLAAVLVMDPRIIVLDEPFTGLDRQGVEDVLKDITRLHREGKTIILITHDLEKSLAHCDRLILMDRGCIQKEGPPGDLLSELENFGIRKPWGPDRSIESMTWLRS